jgi:hypothetical protein
MSYRRIRAARGIKCPDLLRLGGSEGAFHTLSNLVSRKALSARIVSFSPVLSIGSEPRQPKVDLGLDFIFDAGYNVHMRTEGGVFD